ncbi:MAG: hypothetical protein KJ941_02495 [Bacteroidetes bacterium]|nr:hypothetical protein [Bacteroidota bacterium]
MKYIYPYLLSAFFSLVFIFQGFSQGPIDGFLKGKNILDIAVSGGFQKANEYIGAKGPLNIKREMIYSSIFAAYGITKNIDFIATLPYIGSNFQDAGLYVKGRFLQLLNKRLDILAAGGTSFPVGNYSIGSALDIGQKATQFQGKFVAQYTLPHGIYLQAQTGYNYALNPVPSAYLVSSKLMWTPGKWYLDAWINYQNGLGDKVYQGDVPYSSFRELNADFTQIGGTIYRTLNQQFGAFVNGSKIIDGLGTFTTLAIGGGITFKVDVQKKQKISSE